VEVAPGGAAQATLAISRHARLTRPQYFDIIGSVKSFPTLKGRKAASADAELAVSSLAALAQETRLALFRLLVEFAPIGLTPGAIALRLKLAPATLSFHLKELVNARLVTDRREGRFIWYQADLRQMNALIAYLTEHCCQGTGGTACEPGCAPAACAPSSQRTRTRS
jgi:ArsR family transcriptional regulator, arsenate/arsenite/antimonite-responsive transcriptional repressor